MLERYWFGNPHAMELARRAGPAEILTQHRMVTLDDYANRLEDHPLVLRAAACQEWSGSWYTVRVAIVNWNNTALDTAAVSVIRSNYGTR